MAKEKYRLQVVLEMREKLKKEAAQFVVLRRQQLAAAEEELERRKQAVFDNLQMQRDAQDTMFSELNAGAEARFALSYRIHLADLREDEIVLRENVTKQEKAVEQAEKEVERALELLAESAKEMKVIETHKDNWRTDKRRESERREQKLNDEIGAILYSPKR
ncbi:MAG: hypothetical protein H7Z37_06310 [Pyrinomonadaceae bacterium]|nr:hypothetical protein [Pyrinomonadaceae bacterium]